MILKDHKHYVQGVCWDPLSQFVVTNSSDRWFAVNHVILLLLTFYSPPPPAPQSVPHFCDSGEKNF